jgi:hypothetical protein
MQQGYLDFLFLGRAAATESEHKPARRSCSPRPRQTAPPRSRRILSPDHRRAVPPAIIELLVWILVMQIMRRLHACYGTG